MEKKKRNLFDSFLPNAIKDDVEIMKPSEKKERYGGERSVCNRERREVDCVCI